MLGGYGRWFQHVGRGDEGYGCVLQVGAGGGVGDEVVEGEEGGGEGVGEGG